MDSRDIHHYNKDSEYVMVVFNDGSVALASQREADLFNEIQALIVMNSVEKVDEYLDRRNSQWH